MVEVAFVARVTVAGRIAVDGPCLSARPRRIVGIALRRAASAHVARRQVVVHDVITAVIVAEVLLHRSVGMLHRDIIIGAVARKLRGLEHQFEIHHVVDDHRALPAALALPAAVGVPRLDDARHRPETRRERLGRLDDHILVAGYVFQSQSVAVAVVDHEAHVVMPLQVLHRIEDLGMLSCARGPCLVARQFVHVPQRPGEETAHPVVDGHVVDPPVLPGRGDADHTARLARIGQHADLLFGDGDVFVNDRSALRRLRAGGSPCQEERDGRIFK